MINVHKIIEKTIVEGPGTRFCIWVQGCSRHCKDCWANDTWSFNTGIKYSVDELYTKIKSFLPEIEGVTLLGGEPFEQAYELAILAKKIKSEGKSIICFTGYTLDELKLGNIKGAIDLLLNVDILIDGPFEKDKFDLSRPWVGSLNQNYHFLTDFYSPKILKHYKNKIEARIKPNGTLEINGMGDFNKINKIFVK